VKYEQLTGTMEATLHTVDSTAYNIGNFITAGQTEVQSAVNRSSISVRAGRTTIGIGS
jgi:hydrogenase maturation factor